MEKQMYRWIVSGIYFCGTSVEIENGQAESVEVLVDRIAESAWLGSVGNSPTAIHRIEGPAGIECVCFMRPSAIGYGTLLVHHVRKSQIAAYGPCRFEGCVVGRYEFRWELQGYLPVLLAEDDQPDLDLELPGTGLGSEGLEGRTSPAAGSGPSWQGFRCRKVYPADELEGE